MRKKYLMFFIFISVIGKSQILTGTNLDFESGSLTGWSISSELNQNSSMVLGCCATSGGKVVLVNGGIDSVNHISLNSPFGGSWVAKVNEDTSYYKRLTRLSNTFTITSTENILNVAYMAILNKGLHDCQKNPFFNIRIFDSYNTVFYQKFIQSNEVYPFCIGSNCANFTQTITPTSTFYSSPWEVFQIDFSAYLGSVFRIEIIASGCTFGEHSGYGYVDVNLSKSSITPSLLSINDIPYIVTSQNQIIPICSTDSVLINAPIDASSYLWTGPGISGTSTKSVSILNPIGQYTLTYSKPSYWGSSTSTIFNFANTPTVAVFGPTLACSGSVVTFSTTGSSSYTWEPNNVVPYNFPVSPYSIQTLTLIAPNVLTTYTVSGSSFNGCKIEKNFTLNIAPSPTISLISGLTRICMGDSTTLILSGATSYTWNSAPISSNSISILPSTSYTNIVLGFDSLTSCMAKVNIPVLIDDPYISISPSSPKTCLGDSIFIFPSGAVSYSLNGIAFTNNIRILPLLTTTYTLTGLNTCGILSNVFTVTVTPKPIVSITGPSTVCSGYNVNLTAHGASTYLWSGGSSSAINTIYGITSSAVYTVNGLDNGCYGQSSKSITVIPNYSINISAAPKHNICIGQSATLTAIAVGATSYSWITGGATTSSIVITPTISGYPSFNVSATGPTGCVASNLITMDVSNTYASFNFISPNTFTICSGEKANINVCCGALSYLIENTSEIVSHSFTLSPTTSTIYTITSNSGCTIDTKTLQITVLPTPTISILGPDSICKGTIATYTAYGLTSSAWLWSWSSLAAGTSSTFSFTCNETNTLILQNTAAGCVYPLVKNKLIIVKPISPVSIYGNLNYCSISSVSMTAIGSNSYSWSDGFIGNPNVVTSPSALTYSVLAKSLNGCFSSDSINLNSLLIPSTVFITPTSSVSCINSQPIFINPLPLGGDLFINGSASTNTFIPTSSGNYSVTYTYTNINGCFDTKTKIIIINQTPTLSVIGSNSLCIESSTSLIVSGASTYSWSSGSSFSSTSFSPTITTTYSVVGTSTAGCSATQTLSIFVDNTCQDVWPGDANSDGVADNLDVLELGLHYTQTGPSRALTSNLWQSYFSNNWAGTITSGKNLNHSDCNGDGIIDANDTLAIYNNYGLTHAFRPELTTLTDPQLSIISDQAFVEKGNWGSSSIYLGDATAPINTVNGVAFTLNFDNTLIETDSIYLTYLPSFIDAGSNLHFRKRDFVNNKLYTATTHTNNTNVSGFGKIAVLHYKIQSTLTTDSPLNLSIIQGNSSNASGSIVPLTTGTSSVLAVGASVGITSYDNSGKIIIYPNPAKDVLYFETNALKENMSIVVYNAFGQIVLKESIQSTKSKLAINGLANGVYFIDVLTNETSISKTKFVKE